MKITLFLNEKLVDFFLPSQIAGSYSFDADPNEDTKLINVEERDGAWVLYSTAEISVVVDNQPAEQYVLNDEKYVVLIRNEKKYLVYIAPTQEKELSTYSYMPQSTFIIGNTPECNIRINSEVLGGTIVKEEVK